MNKQTESKEDQQEEGETTEDLFPRKKKVQEKIKKGKVRLQKVLVGGGRQNVSPQWLSVRRLRHISSDRSWFQAQTNSPSASPADPPFAPGIELGLPHYTVAMGTLTPLLTK